MFRITLVFSIFLSVLSPAQTLACSCLRISAQDYYNNADMVFVGKAQKTSAPDAPQSFNVLHRLKGKPGAKWTQSDNNVQATTCGTHFSPGQVSIVLATRGSVNLCNGNFGARIQLDDAITWLEASGGHKEAIPDVKIRPVLDKVLESYSHVKGPLNFQITQSIRLGKLWLVHGTIKVEGVAFAVLMDDSGVLMQSITER